MTAHAPDLPVSADAPGRVNLLGEHTDYSEGYVLPTAIPQRTTVTLRRGRESGHSLRSAEIGQLVHFSLDAAPEEAFARYVYGCLVEASKSGLAIAPLDIEVRSEVPIGVGLSSSAALEVATLRALREFLAAPWDAVEIARMAQRAEIEHAGVRCGIMDQMAASLGDTESALFLDTRTLQCRRIALPRGTQVLVLDSGISRSLAESGYNQRRSECEAAARQLGVGSLRDASALTQLEGLPELLRRRARHVLSENARVLEALTCGDDAGRWGLLMNQSHASLRDDFEVSVEPLDRLVALLQAHPAVYGAKLTGAGFGGACVALCVSSELLRVAGDTLQAFAAVGGRGRLLVPVAPAVSARARVARR